MANTSQMDEHVTFLDDNSERAGQPRLINTPMKPHQLTMLEACRNIENGTIKNSRADMTDLSSRVGVICDLVGSGKSLSTLSIIANNPMAPTKEKPSKTFDKYGLISMKQITDKRRTVFIPLNILVVPHTIIRQWKEYVKDNTDIQYYTIENKKTLLKFEADFNKNFIDSARDDFKEPEKIFGYNLLLVTSTQFTYLANILQHVTYYLRSYDELQDKRDYKIVFSRVLYDEADSIKLPNNAKIPANFYWFITSTITSLLYPDGRRYFVNDQGQMSQYYSGEYWRRIFLDGLQNNGFIKGLFQSIQHMGEVRNLLFLKNNPEFVAKSFLLMKPIIKEILCQSPAMVNILSGIVSHAIMDCINAGDIDSAIEKMACEKVTSKISVVEVFTKKLEAELHNKRLEHNMVSQLNISAESKKTQLATLDKKIGEITEKIKCIKERIEREDTCPICYDKITNETVVKCCGNSFCFECLTQTFKYNLSSNRDHTSVKDTCPCCRAVLTQDSIMIVTEKDFNASESGDGAGSKEPLTKLDQMREIIIETFKETGRKMLIFSNYYNSFTKIAEILSETGVKYKEIKGTGSSVNNIIRMYKETDELNCLLLNSTNIGAGLNLENTTDLVLYHNMSSELSIQVIGRAQRPGRTSSLNIYRLVYDNEQKNLADISPIAS